jgi:uncharacterized protein
MRALAPTVLFAALSLLAACRSAPEPQATLIAGPAALAAPRSLSVSGAAEIETTPDEFVIAVGFDNFAADAAKAKADNDAVMRVLLDVPRRFGADPRGVRTESFSLSPRFEGPWEARRLVGFEAKKTLVVTLHDDKQVEPALEALFTGGANRLDGVTFRSTRMLEQRKEARTRAVAAAREKAEAMAREVGQRLGHPLKIEETGAPGPWSPGPELNMVVNNGSRSELHEAMAAGKIHVAATVAITFELHDG